MSKGLVVFLVAAVLSCAFGDAQPLDPMMPNYDNIPQCLQPAVTGMCLAYIPSFYYNPSLKKCVSFIYGGCQGNLNRFFSEAECMSVCGGFEVTREEHKPDLGPNAVKPNSEAGVNICSQPKRQGLCYGFLNRFYYNGDKCVPFVYGGCDGNQNNFQTEEECAKTCPSKVVENQPKEKELPKIIAVEKLKPAENVEEFPEIIAVEVAKPAENVDVCSQPQRPGLCYGLLPRFFFNGENCEAFDYGGCDGNQNNFETEEECNKACPPKAVKSKEKEANQQ